MTIFDAIVLGIIQGLTEFLPVSSSGHLVLSQEIMGINSPGVTFEIVVHLGSLVAILCYFHKLIFSMIRSLFTKNGKESYKLLTLVVIGTIPTIIAALLLKEYFEAAFSNAVITSFMLLVTGAILLSTRYVTNGSNGTSYLSALIIGISQILAIFPGISRSGTTISTALWLKMKPSRAAEFSFLLAIPAILGALVYKFDELSAVPSQLFVPYLSGLVASFLCSLLAVYLVMTLLKKGKFEYFAYYCFAAGLFGLYLFY